MSEIPTQPTNGHYRKRLGLILTLLGFLIFLIGSVPGVFGLDRSPVIGFVQISVFLIGLGFICVGGYILMNGLWNGYTRTIPADIGLRLVSTGYVIAVASGMADVFGFGSQTSPEIPYYGPWQAGGVLFGEIVIILGFLLQVPFKSYQENLDKPTKISPEKSQNQINSFVELIESIIS